MKKLFTVFAVIFVFLLVGCDKNTEVDMNNSPKLKAEMGKVSPAEVYGEVIHKGVYASKTIVKNMKASDDIYSLAVGMLDGKERYVVVYTCDLRSNASVITVNIKDSNGHDVQGNVELSIMKYRPGVTDIRESDDEQDPVFSTANGDEDYLGALDIIKKLPKDTVIGFTVDAEREDGSFQSAAWSPLFTVKQFLDALPSDMSKCVGTKLDLGTEHVMTVKRDQ